MNRYRSNKQPDRITFNQSTINSTINPSINPTINSTINPSINPTINSTINPTINPTIDPTIDPTINSTNYQNTRQYKIIKMEIDSDDDMIQKVYRESIEDEMLRKQEEQDFEIALQKSKLEHNMPIADNQISTKHNLIDQYIMNLISFVKNNNADHADHVDHIDFIIGRGKSYPEYGLNLPLNPDLITSNRNIIFIDQDLGMNPDINQRIEDVDFMQFNICKTQDPDEKIYIRFFFDWSSFYCGAVQSLTQIIKKIGRKCQIFVPLYIDENKIPGDVIRELSDNIFKINIIEGKYPMFNWDPSIIIPKLDNKTIGSIVNENYYMKIDAY